MKTASVTPRRMLLHEVPDSLRAELWDAFDEVESNYFERRWEPAELNGAKLCEAVVAILEEKAAIEAGRRDKMPQRCNRVESSGVDLLSDSLRLVVPKVILALYNIRNHRGVGHAFGDVKPNVMDAESVVAMSRWLVAELIRHFHEVSPDEAQATVNAIVERNLPFIWEVDGISREVSDSLSQRDEALLLLYGSSVPLHEDELVASVEPKSAAIFRRDTLRPLHKTRLLYFNESNRIATLAPAGATRVEKAILPKLRSTEF